MRNQSSRNSFERRERESEKNSIKGSFISMASSSSWQRAVIVLAAAVVGGAVVVALYWAQTIFIPLALAVYLAFLLSPVVRALERLHLGRILSVFLAVGLMALVLGSIGWIVSLQITGLIKELPKFTDQFKAKIDSVRSSGRGSPWGAIEKTAQDINETLNPKPKTEEKGAEDGDADAIPAASQAPRPVAVQPEGPIWITRLPSFLSSLAEFMGGLALTMVLVLFMLLKREDLRNRLLWLLGHGSLTVTTKALDDAGQRISRFLITQAIVNCVFGVTLGVGLFLIGVEYAFLWGFLAALLRYLPYVGTWIAAIMPITLSLGMFDGWLQPVLVIGLFVVIELVCSNVVEPRFFGRSMGVSEVALLVAAAFWAFLWGPIGLFLSNPLTVCLVVLGKYVPQLKFFNVLLGDEPPLELDVSFYQRLLARDQDEATQLVQTQVRGASRDQVYDRLLVPALAYLKRDREREELSEADEQFILQAIREIMDDLGEGRPPGNVDEPRSDAKPAALMAKVHVLACPARDDADQLALEMLRQLLHREKWDVQICGVELLSAELVAQAEETQAAVICIASVPPGGLAHCRYLCKRFRSRVPDARIVVGRWGLKSNLGPNRDQLREAGADQVDATLLETRKNLHAWLPVFSQEQPESMKETVLNPQEQHA
jgi:predicted PurR-regulated permease PerM